MTKTKKLDMELPKEGRFISSEFPILRDNLNKLDQALITVEEKINQKAPLQHMHTISDVTGLESALNGKMSADKTFTFADLSDIEGAKDAANNYVLYKAGNNHFTFGSAVSLLGAHKHKTEDIVGLDDFRAKINQDLTAYGRLASPNEWQSYNKFTSKVTIGGDLELLSNSSLNLTHNGEVVTRLSATGSTLKGPLKVDGEAVYTKSQVDQLIASFVKQPVEILMTESGPIPFPEGVSDDTEVEIWAWGGGGGGGFSNSGGGGGGGCVRVQIKGSQLRRSRSAQIGRGGNSGGGGATIIQGIVKAGGGGGGGNNGGSGSVGDVNGNGRGGNGGSYYSDSPSLNGSDTTFNGGGGGSYGKKVGAGGHGGDSIFGGGGGSSSDIDVKGGYSGKGGNGGSSGNDKAGGGGGYFHGKNGDEGGAGGNGAILLRFFI
ncbi:Bgr_08870 family protein [Bartonella senegalensis]|uniref:Bgr_08870 family protein n=1 Tax=Bartonella senegalensis TaxID=1468418 RepID=UPI0005540773|nr:Bgr_08870 family protein [Bartonella senegalensis]